MLMKLNLDDDLRDEVKRDLDPSSAWFRNLPIRVQVRKLLPYVDRQHARDVKRLGKALAA